jgi:hypothetical protein
MASFRTFCLALSLFCLHLPGTALCEEEVRIPDGVTPGLVHLLSLVGPEAGPEFKPEQIAPVLEFIDLAKTPGAMYVPDTLDRGSSAYIDLDLRQSLAEVLRYTFNPAIPWFVATPSSLRATAWKKTETPHNGFPRLWELLGDLSRPIVIRGVETVENTPDLTSGGYYRYDLHRTLILFRSGERRVLISLARQAGASEVGRKGYILGDDRNWNYFYSGETGLSVTGLGWVKSHMFDSAGISVYSEKEPAGSGVRIANFKWLRAGWSGLNVVRSEHILEGLKRFAQATKEVLESPRLPAAKTLEDACLRIARLSDDQIRQKISVYRSLLAARGERLAGGARKHLPESFWDDDLWARMTRGEMESALLLETLKSYLGKISEAEARELALLPPLQAPQQGG